MKEEKGVLGEKTVQTGMSQNPGGANSVSDY